MKKNRTMRVAALLLALTLMTSCFVGGTFAKYTTAGESNDSARVARFGVTVTADYSDLFKDQYNTTTAWTGDDGVSVKSIFGGDVIAPGTDGALADFTVVGQPEVDVLVSYTVDFELGDNWKVEGVEYCPLVITVNTKEYKIGGADLNGANITTVAELESAVEAAIVASGKYYNAGVNLGAVAGDLEVSWEWPFHTSDENDIKDTALGDAFNATISLDIKCTIEQVD